MKKNLYLLLLVSYTQLLLARNFDDIWQEMQNKYINLTSKFQSSANLHKKYTTCYWNSVIKDISYMLNNKPDINFLKHKQIAGAMVRTDLGLTQKFEENYLTYCLNEQTKKIIDKFIDQDNNLLEKTILKFKCSVNSLGHLYYISKILENFSNNAPKRFVEFGGGYGNLARIIKQLLPKTTIIIFDLPEIIALQYVFLSYTMPDTKIYIKDMITESDLFEEDAIYLLPVYLLNQCDFKTDIFVSTFALSEATEYVQKLLIKKRFFNAQLCYITGQIPHCLENDILETDHNNIINSVRNLYKTTICNPFHIYFDPHALYEIIGKDN